MVDQLLALPVKLFLGKGIIDKKFPFLLSIYKKVYSLMAKKGEVKVTIPFGLKLLVAAKDYGLGMYLRTKGEFEPLQTKLFLESLTEGMTVFDIGANVGYYTVLASKMVGAKGKVYAFEPDPNSVKLLKKNIMLNNYRNVIVVPHAVGRKDGAAILSIDEANPGESYLGGNGSNRQMIVRAIALDSFVHKRKITNVDVVKMDVEGGEVDVLSGGKSFFRKQEKLTLFTECNPRALMRFRHTAMDLVRVIENLKLQIKTIVNEFNTTCVEYSDKTLNEILTNVTIAGLKAQK